MAQGLTDATNQSSIERRSARCVLCFGMEGRDKNMDRAALVLMLAGGLGLSGCAAGHSEASGGSSVESVAFIGHRASANLLFDQYPSASFSAQDFHLRSEWPVAIVGTSYGEIISLREQFVDREREFSIHTGQTVRTVRIHRESVQVRD